ncbi:hypothetical protein DPEC_G00065440 [Dallia pectoralis]|uniref:Uncharacterized protein n=1 Tax=Dallia pectoralis TaxID=75939 RepID=A0ACC2H8Q9_DALPE|nr:hypothetical protein DPEC_G00065440 [Dallia pectoralis]
MDTFSRELKVTHILHKLLTAGCFRVLQTTRGLHCQPTWPHVLCLHHQSSQLDPLNRGEAVINTDPTKPPECRGSSMRETLISQVCYVFRERLAGGSKNRSSWFRRPLTQSFMAQCLGCVRGAERGESAVRQPTGLGFFCWVSRGWDQVSVTA